MSNLTKKHYYKQLRYFISKDQSLIDGLLISSNLKEFTYIRDTNTNIQTHTQTRRHPIIHTGTSTHKKICQCQPLICYKMKQRNFILIYFKYFFYLSAATTVSPPSVASPVSRASAVNICQAAMMNLTLALRCAGAVNTQLSSFVRSCVEDMMV